MLKKTNAKTQRKPKVQALPSRKSFISKDFQYNRRSLRVQPQRQQENSQKKEAKTLYLNRSHLQYQLFRKSSRLRLQATQLNNKIERQRGHILGSRVYEFAAVNDQLKSFFAFKNRKKFVEEFGKYINIIFRNQNFFDGIEMRRIHSVVSITSQLFSTFKGMLFGIMVSMQNMDIKEVIRSSKKLQKYRGCFVNHSLFKQKISEDEISDDILKISSKETINQVSALFALVQFVIYSTDFQKIIAEIQTSGTISISVYLQVKRVFLLQMMRAKVSWFVIQQTIQNLNLAKFRLLGYLSIKNYVIQRFKSFQSLFLEFVKYSKITSQLYRPLYFILLALVNDDSYIFSSNEVITIAGMNDSQDILNKLLIMILNFFREYLQQKQCLIQVIAKLRLLKSFENSRSLQQSRLYKLQQTISIILNNYKDSMQIFEKMCPAIALSSCALGVNLYSKDELVYHHSQLNKKAHFSKFSSFIKEQLKRRNSLTDKEMARLDKHLAQVNQSLYS